jgi:hypothetical protein
MRVGTVQTGPRSAKSSHGFLILRRAEAQPEIPFSDAAGKQYLAEPCDLIAKGRPGRGDSRMKEFLERELLIDLMFSLELL